MPQDLQNEYKLGATVRHGDSKLDWLVVRIVREDEALIVDDKGNLSVSLESYVMLKSEHGEIDFIVLLHEEKEAPIVSPGKVVPLPSLWRKFLGGGLDDQGTGVS